MTAVPLAALLGNLQAELGRMAARSLALEEAAGAAARQAAPGAARHEALMAFQELDLLTQSLRDLARLAGFGATTCPAIDLDQAAIRGTLTLTSLADRLLGAQGVPDAAEATHELF